jgi:hypothetical protein
MVRSDPDKAEAGQWTVVSEEKNGRRKLERDEPFEVPFGTQGKRDKQGKQARMWFGIHEKV